MEEMFGATKSETYELLAKINVVKIIVDFCPVYTLNAVGRIQWNALCWVGYISEKGCTQAKKKKSEVFRG